jgi:hypothetical protein
LGAVHPLGAGKYRYHPPLLERPLDPAIPQERKGFNSRAIIDATKPYEWRDKFPAVNAVSDDFKTELDRKYATLLKEVTGAAR